MAPSILTTNKILSELFSWYFQSTVRLRPLKNFKDCYSLPYFIRKFSNLLNKIRIFVSKSRFLQFFKITGPYAEITAKIMSIVFCLIWVIWEVKMLLLFESKYLLFSKKFLQNSKIRSSTQLDVIVSNGAETLGARQLSPQETSILKLECLVRIRHDQKRSCVRLACTFKPNQFTYYFLKVCKV